MQLLYLNKSIVLKLLHNSPYSSLRTVIFSMKNRQTISIIALVTRSLKHTAAQNSHI